MAKLRVPEVAEKLAQALDVGEAVKQAMIAFRSRATA